ncbi:MAG: SDR family oxidoreductase [Thermoflexales bacterium]|nr:SDR family oxidoreductase [Thermoflexales bacterium]
MKALVIGASGQVGGALVQVLAERGHTAVGTYRQQSRPDLIALDTADSNAVEQLLGRLQPDWIFYPAGLSWVDLCECESERCFNENVRWPVAVATLAAQQGVGFVYFSSEYVFDGEAGPYDEQAVPRPLSVYGRSKLAAEHELVTVNPAVTIVRTTVVYGPEFQQKNFIYQLIAKTSRGETLPVPTDQISTPTYNCDLAAASIECAERRVTGAINLVGPDRLDRYAFALAACRIFGLDERLIVPRSTADLKQLAPRPLNAGLINAHAQQILCAHLRGVDDGLHAMQTALAPAAHPD